MKSKLFSFVLAAALFAHAAFAANGSVTAATGGTNLSADLAANGATPTYTTLGNIAINEGNGGNRSDITPSQTNVTLILARPTGWEFQAGVGSASTSGGSVTIGTLSVTTTTITLTFSTNAATNNQDTITISGIKVRATNALISGSPAGNITRGGGTAAFSNFDGNNLNSTNFGSLSEIAGAANKLVIGTNVPATGTAGVAFSPSPTVRIEDAYGNLRSGDTTTITATRNTGSGTASMQGTTSVAAVAGIATFSNLRYNLAQTISVDFSAGVLTGATSSAIAIAPAATSTFALTTPVSANAGSAFSFGVQAKDAFGNDTPAYAGTVHFTSTDAQAVLPADTALTGGSATLNATLKTAGSRTITATDTVSAPITGTSSAITVNPGAAASLQVAIPASVTAGSAFNATVTAKDAYGNTATGYAGTVQITSSDAQAVLPANNTLTGGTGTFSVTLKTAGSRSVTATDTFTPSITGFANTTVNAAGAASFTVSAPASATAGSAFNVTVTAKDAFDNVATGYAGTVQFTSNDGQAVLPPNSTLTSGTGTFSVTLRTAGSRSVTATDTVSASITGSANVTVSAGATAAFSVSAPASATAGSAFNATVTATDAWGNTTPSYAGTVAFSSSDAQAVVPGNSTLTAGSGTFSFTLKTAGSRSITATDTVSASITGTANVTVSAGATAAFTVAAPASATAGASFNATVTAKDAFGNTTTAYTGTVAFSSGDPQAVVPSNATLTAGTGTFSFTLKTAGAQTVTATDTVTPSITGSDTVTVNATTATRLGFTTQPGNATAGAVFGTQPVVKTQDAFGNDSTVGLNPNVNVTITLTTGTGPLQGTATGNIGTNGSSGTLAFTNLRIDNAADTKQLTASANTYTSGLSNTFTVSPAATSTLAVSAPASATAGSAFNVTVTARDAFGNTTPAYAGMVAFSSNDGQAVLPSNSTLTSGTGTFSVTLKTSGSRSVVATDTVTPSITGSANVTVSAGAATSLALTGVPASTTAGSALTVTVTARDALNNVATSYAGTVAISSSDGSATLPANATLVSGTRNFSVTLKTAGAQSVTATDTVNATLTSTQNTTVNPAATSTFTVSAPAGTTAGNAFNATVTAKDAFGNTTPAYAGTVHFTSSDAQAVLPANAPLTAGTGTFSVTLKTAGSRTVVATDTVAPSITGSANVTVSAAATSALAVAAPANATAGNAFNATVTATDAFGNTTTAYAGTVTFSSSDAQAVLPANATLTAGTGTFSFTLKTAGAQSLTATDTVAPSISGSDTIAVAAAAASRLAFTTQPGNATAGAPFGTQPVVKTQDAFGNDSTVGLNNNVNITVALTTGTGPLQGTASGNIGNNGGGGTLAFTNLRIDNASDTKQLTVTGGGFTAGVSNTFTVNPGATSTLTVTAPASATAGSAFNATVTAKDAFGNTTPAYAGTVAITSSDAQAVLPPNSTLTSGSSTFSVTLKTAGTRTVVATDTQTPSITGSANVTVSAGAPATVTKTAGDGQTLTAGASVTATVNVKDAFGNNVPSTAVTFAITAGNGTANGGATANVNTDASGNASVTWTFGPVAGANAMTATAGAASATFNGTGTCTFTTKASGNWNAPSTWVGECVPGASDAVTIASGHVVTVTANAAAASLTFATASVDSRVQLNSGVTLAVSGLLRIHAPAPSNVESTIAVGDGTLNIGALELNGAGNRKAILSIANGTVNLAGDATFPGNPPTQQINITGSGAFNITGNFAAGATIDHTGAGSFRFHGSGAQTIGSYNPSNSFPTTQISSNVQLLGNLTVDGTLTIDAGKSLDAGSGTLQLGGNLTANGAFASAGTVIANGSAAQTFGGTTSPLAFTNLTMNNAAGLTLGVPVTVAGTLTLTSGNVSTATSVTILPGGGVARTSGHVIGNLVKTFSAASALTFEVGTANGYSPVGVNATSGTFPATLSARAVQGPHPSSPSANALQRYWTLGAGAIATADLTFSYLAGDVVGNEMLYKLGRFASGWTYPPASVDSVNHVATANGVAGLSGDFTLHLAATALRVSSVNGGVNPVAGAPFSITVESVDAANNPANVSNTTTVALTLTAGTGPLGGTLTGQILAGTSSVVISGVTYTKAESGVVVTASATAGSSLTAGASAPFTVDPGPTSRFIVTAPATSTAGAAFNVGVTAVDAFDNVTPAFAGSVTFTSSDPNATLPAPSTLTAGSGTFSATLVTAGTQSITATSGAITGSANVAVDPAATSTFAVTAPATATAGSAFDFTVTARDAYGNTTPAFAGTVTFTSSDTGATLPASSTLTSGSGTFSATLVTAGTRSITATSGAITGSANVTVNAAAPDHFTLKAPVSATAGVAFNVDVEVFDAYGNPTPSYAGTVAFGSSDANATLPASSTLTGGSGTFSVTLRTAGARTVAATDGPITGSANVTVNPAALDHFLVEAAGGGSIAPQTAGAPFSVALTAQDAFGNTVTSFGGTVQLTANATLAGAPVTSGAFTNGVLASQPLTITSAQTGTTVSATDTGSGRNGTSNAFTVNPAGTASFLIEAAGGGSIAPQTAGSPFGVRITARDSFGNTTTSFAGTLDLTSTAGSVTPSTVTFVAGDNGVKTVNVTLTVANASATLTATHTPSGNSGTSNPFAVNAAGANAFLVEAGSGGNIAPQTAGSPFAIRVTARDAFGNTAAGFTGAMTLSTNAGTIAPPTVTFDSADAGVKVVSVTLSASGTNRTITATGTAGSGTSNPFTVNAGPLDHFRVEAAGGGSIGAQTAGEAFAIRVTALDANDNLVPSFNGAGNTVDITSTGSLTAGGSTTAAFANGVLASHSVTIGNGGSFTITATRTGGAQSGTSNTFAVIAGADLAVTFGSSAITLTPGVSAPVTLTVTNLGPSTANAASLAFTAPAGWSVAPAAPCASFPCALGNLASGASVSVTIVLTAPIGSQPTAFTLTATVSSATNDPVPANNTATAIAHVALVACPTGISEMRPDGSGGVSGDLTWVSANADTYEVFLGPAGSGCTNPVGLTAGTRFAYRGLEPGRAYEWRVVTNRVGCAPVVSACVRFTTSCATARISGIAESMSRSSYRVHWTRLDDVRQYELQESTSIDFATATTTTTAAQVVPFRHEVTVPTPFYYRVRAAGACTNAWSATLRVVVQPPQSPHDDEFDLVVEHGSSEVVTQDAHLDPPQALGALAAGYTAGSDAAWLSVTPAAGTIPPGGITFTITADPSRLPAGSSTASVTVRSSTGETLASWPVSLHAMLPVEEVGKSSTLAESLVIAGVAHAAGAGSTWRSDVRIHNPSSSLAAYDIWFTPSRTDGTKNGRRTAIEVAPGATLALGDVVRRAFGYGSLAGESATGSLEIRPRDAAPIALVTSRTYNVTPDGTYGQFMPATNTASFATRGTTLSLQQVAQSSAYRTNLGVVEGSGTGAALMIRIYDAAGAKLAEVPVALAPFEQQQIDSVLAKNGVTAADARIEVDVTSPNGSVAAYASVVDNATNDSLLVPGVAPARIRASRYVVPGVADFTTARNTWRSDVRIYNAGAASVSATVLFYPDGGAAPMQRAITIAPREVKSYDGVLRSLFDTRDTGGALHVVTTIDTSLVVTARTYDQRNGGTYGQFIPAMLPSDATSLGARPLQLLHVDQSPRYRANVGVAEVSGKAATVELVATLADGRTAATTIELAANEFRQVGSLLATLGFTDATNARVTVRVTAGTGRVVAYVSTIDNRTQDPTYVPGSLTP